VVESSSGGTADKVYTTVSQTLVSYVENLYAQGFSSISLTGNDLSNTITGSTGANVINGGLGKDTFIFNNMSKLTVGKLAQDAFWKGRRLRTRKTALSTT
jgi:Ca2+-binding RTX toxin-like protein